MKFLWPILYYKFMIKTVLLVTFRLKRITMEGDIKRIFYCSSKIKNLAENPHLSLYNNSLKF